MKLRRLSSREARELREAIRAARVGEGDGLIYELSRGFSNPVRALARIVVGLGVVVVMLAGVAAFLAPDSAGTLIAAGVVPAGVLATMAALFGYEFDTGLRIYADGRIRREGWSGIRELDLRSFVRVTVAERLHSDVGGVDI